MTLPFGKVRENRAKQERWLGGFFSLTTVGLVIVAWASVQAIGQTPAPVPSHRVLALYPDERLLPLPAGARKTVQKVERHCGRLEDSWWSRQSMQPAST
jgi:hypothetical protein